MANLTAASVDLDVIREIVGEHLHGADVSGFAPEQDLYAAGLTSLATVGLMLALEDRFEIEFTEAMLGRGTFRSLGSIAEAVAALSK